MRVVWREAKYNKELFSQESN